MTVEEFIETDDDRRTELVRGRVVELRFRYPFEGYVCGNVGGELFRYAEQSRLGRVVLNTGVVTGRNPDTVREADISFYSYTRLPGPLPYDSYAAVMPELIVEVRLPSDPRSPVSERVAEYLTAGVSVVCVVDAKAGTATIYRDNQDPEPVAADADLTFPDVLPGFRVPMRRFFE